MIGTDILGESTGKEKGLGLGLGINLDVAGVESLVGSLSDALNQTGSALSDSIARVVQSVRELGIENLKNWAQQGGEQPQSLYGQLVSKLQEAAGRGEEQAKSLLNSLGENAEAVGQKVQSAASEETTH